MKRSSIHTAPEPAAEEIDRIIRDLEASWKATITVRRQAPNDVGYREVFVSLDGEKPATLLNYGETLTLDVKPGPHRLSAHNTLFVKTIDFTVNVGEHATFTAINRAGFGTYSALAFFVGFLGAGPFYLTFVKDV
jgi:hypothetical protein